MKETKAWVSGSRVRFVSASILPCHSRAMPTEPHWQHSLGPGSAAGTHRTYNFVSRCYWGSAYTAYLSSPYGLYRTWPDPLHQPQSQHQCNLYLQSHIFILNQFISIYSIKGSHVHRATSVLPRWILATKLLPTPSLSHQPHPQYQESLYPQPRLCIKKI